MTAIDGYQNRLPGFYFRKRRKNAYCCVVQVFLDLDDKDFHSFIPAMANMPFVGEV
jgi:hypothetical protein